MGISGFPNVAPHFKLAQERPIVKKLLADCIITFAEIVDSENIIAGTDGGRVHPQIA